MRDTSLGAKQGPGGSARRAAGVARTFRAGLAHHQQGRLARAETLYRRALAKDPGHADALHLLGVVAYQCGRHGVALALIERALPALGELPDAHLNHGNALLAAGRSDAAAASFRRAIALRPDYGMAHNNLARALFALGDYPAALESARRATALIPDFAGAQVNLAAALFALDRHAEAEAPLRRALGLTPEHAGLYRDLAKALEKQGKLDEALDSCRRAVALAAQDAVAHFDLGRLARAARRPDEALASYREAVRLRPDFAEAHNNLGNVLKEMGEPEQAIASYRQALALAPDDAAAHNNLGSALYGRTRLDEAVASFRRAIELRPDFAAAHHNLANTLDFQGRLDEAMASFARAIALQPAYASADWFHARKRLWDWANYRDDEARIRGRSDTHPFMSLAMSSTPAEQLDCGRRAAAKAAVPASAALPPRQPSPGGRIHIGYLSADFNSHAVAFLIAGLIEHHDRSDFDVVGYSLGRNDGSEIRTRLVAAFDRFVDLTADTDGDAARGIHHDAVDILIDLNAHTRGGRPGILARRPAPIQVNYLGYPGTMGADFIDYIIVDRFVVPADQQPFFSERLVHLPDCYQSNDDKRALASYTPSRGECGLPADGFVFCCFNNAYKITPDFFDIWMRLLRAVPGSVLWLLGAHPAGCVNLEDEAAARGIAPDRLVFAPRMPLGEHLVRHRLADLFLDTLPYNAHTTASDALWVGLPLVTCVGDTFAGRVAGSLLRAVGLPELATHSREEYEALALRLALDPPLLAGLRARLARNRLTCPLFDTARFARNLEAAYHRMQQCRIDGLTPAAFAVAETMPPPRQ